MPETTLTRPAWKCQLCGHPWPKRSDTPPEKCSKCHSRDWNGARAAGNGNRFTARWSHQKKVRAAQARRTPATPEQLAAGRSLQNATVREVTRKDIKALIEQYEYLGNLGSGRYYYALIISHEGKEYMGGACCFGDVAGTAVNMICGSEHAKEVICLIRGACVTMPPILYWSSNSSSSSNSSDSLAACRLNSSKSNGGPLGSHGFQVPAA
jgi:hypothetical protein